MKFTFLPHIAVQVPDIEKAKKFYMEVLGMSFIKEYNSETQLSVPGATFYMEQSTAGKTFFAFEVPALADAKKLLMENNCVITSETDEGFMVNDPHGLSYYVSQCSETDGNVNI